MKSRSIAVAFVLTALALGLAAAVAAWLWLAPVRVTSVSPAEGAVPVTAPIQVAFSSAMDAASVQAHLRVEPAAAGAAAVDGRRVTWQPAAPWAPNTTYTVTLEAGAAAALGRRTVARGQSWTFHTRPACLLYLAPAPGGEADVRQIYFDPLDGSSRQAITGAPLGVFDYAVEPQGRAVVYSALREDGGADLWRVDLAAVVALSTPPGAVPAGKPRRLLDCAGAACLAPAWSPDGRTIAYERRDIYSGGPNLDPKAGRLWLLDVETGKAHPLFDYDVPLHSAAWAADSGSLAYASPLVPAIEVLDLAGGDIRTFPNEWGAQPAWSPASPAAGAGGAGLVASDLALLEEPEELLVVHLFALGPQAGQAVDLSTAAGGSALVKDTGPAWSPGGGWIAFSRQSFEAEQWTAGRQIWLMRPTGSEAYPLVTDAAGDLFGLAWRPDGGALAYLRVDVSTGPQAQPQVGIWILDLTTRRSEQVGDGVMARWLP